MSVVNDKDTKEGKLNRKKSVRIPSASNSVRTKSPSPDVTSTPKKAKKKKKKVST